MQNNTTSIGKHAEQTAQKFLKKQGYKILAINWRTRYCEIDIVAHKDKIVYFVEVKYRGNNICGDGLDAITTKKLKQMIFAAELWVNNNNWQGEYQLAVISVSGDKLEIDSFLLI